MKQEDHLVEVTENKLTVHKKKPWELLTSQQAEFSTHSGITKHFFRKLENPTLQSNACSLNYLDFTFRIFQETLRIKGKKVKDNSPLFCAPPY